MVSDARQLSPGSTLFGVRHRGSVPPCVPKKVTGRADRQKHRHAPEVSENCSATLRMVHSAGQFRPRIPRSLEVKWPRHSEPDGQKVAGPWWLVVFPDTGLPLRVPGEPCAPCGGVWYSYGELIKWEDSVNCGVTSRMVHSASQFIHRLRRWPPSVADLRAVPCQSATPRGCARGGKFHPLS